MTIAVIGLGQMGSALAYTAADNGNALRLVGTPMDKEIIDSCKETGVHPKFGKAFPEGTEYYYAEDWKKAVNGSDFVIGGISSFGVEWFLDEILSNMDPQIPVITATKGLMDMQDGSLISYPAYWEGELAKRGIERDIYAIGGPCTADELMQRDHTEVAFCGKSTKILRMLKSALSTPYFHISLTRDVNGLECAVALKNAYALGVAMAIGVEYAKGDEERFHYNSQAAVFYQASKEMYRLLQLMHANIESIMMGLGDLYVTANGGRSRKIGILLGEGNSYEEAVEKLNGITLESVVVIRRVASALRKRESMGLMNLEDFPLLMHIFRVLDENEDPEFPWDRFTFEHLTSR